MSSAKTSSRRKILALSSGGGHWLQLCRLLPAFQDHDVVLATTHAGYSSQAQGYRFRAIPDATRWNKLKLVWLSCHVLILLLRERPDIVISTGAAPGYLALRLGKLLRMRTIWVDSIANAKELSLSGQKIGPYADLWLTQWEHLARPGGPHYAGSVL